MNDTQNLENLKLLELENMEVCEWHPSKNGRGDPVQVHVLFTIVGSPVQLVLRLKSSNACDDLIAALQKHRVGVWGNR